MPTGGRAYGIKTDAGLLLVKVPWQKVTDILARLVNNFYCLDRIHCIHEEVARAKGYVRFCSKCIEERMYASSAMFNRQHESRVTPVQGKIKYVPIAEDCQTTRQNLPNVLTGSLLIIFEVCQTTLSDRK